MKFYLIAFILFLSSPLFLRAETPDSVVKWADLNFSDETERAAFIELKAGQNKEAALNFLLAPYADGKRVSSSRVNQELTSCVELLKKETEGKSPAKKIKHIYNHVHERFFKVYSLENSFCAIFDKGEYNCVSATALYAFLFLELAIPFHIMEKPHHVYLIAYPETQKIMIETTTPSNGYFAYNDNYIQKYVNSLYADKIISKEEKENTPAAELFNKYFFSSETISFVQLAGLQYTNYSIYAIEDKKAELALESAKKAYFIYPCERTKFLLKQTLIYKLSTASYTDDKDLSSLTMLCHYHNPVEEEVSSETLYGEFTRILQIQLINNSNYALFERSHQAMISSLKDTALINRIDFAYHFELARLGLVNVKNNKEELMHLRKAHAINPSNANLHALILAYFGHQLKTMADSRTILASCKEFQHEFTFLSDNELMCLMMANCFLDIAFQEAQMQRLQSAENSLKDFESLADLKKVNPDEEMVEKAYSSVALSYYKKGNVVKTKQLLKKGLTYTPNSYKMKRLLSGL
jgi:hypothetical protein